MKDLFPIDWKQFAFLLSLSCLVLSGFAKNAEKKTPVISEAKSILFLGDSLTAGYGVADGDSFVDLFKEKIKSNEKLKHLKVINGAVSGSTTASCSQRLKWQLKSKLNVVFIALGANDGLRGLPVKESKKNLEDCIKMAKKSKVEVLMAGMLLPKNYGEKYRKEFSQMYSELVKKYKVKFYPFLLKDVGGVSNLNQADGIHPNEKGHKIIFKNIYPFLEGSL
ncbi:MAG: arylesterase [Bdellovibrionota bacterium]